MSEGVAILNRILEKAKKGIVFEPAVSVTVNILRPKRLPFIDFFLMVFPRTQYVVSVHVASRDTMGHVSVIQQEFLCESVEVVCQRVLWERTRRLGEGVCVISDYTVKPDEPSPFDHIT